MASTAAFTLIELLVVIAIVGILAAIILPVISSIRRSAADVQCRSNMRQIGLAIRSYAAEHQGRAPAGTRNDVSPGKPNGIGWDIVIQQYLALTWTKDTSFGELFVCPEAKRTFPAPPSSTYLLNATGADPSVPLLFTLSSTPAKAILLAEGGPNGTQGASFGVASVGSIAQGNFDWRHGDDTQQHVVFADCSVGTLSKSSMTDGSLEAMLRNIRR